MKHILTAVLIGIIGLFLVRITGRIMVAGRTGTAFMYDLDLDGARVLVRGTEAANPLLVFADDTGSPSLPYARTIDAPLLDRYTTVHHDAAGVTVLLDTLRALFPDAPVVLAGHGVGTGTCLRHAAAPGVSALILINPPYDRTATDAGIFTFALDAAKARYNKQAMCELITTDARTGTSRCAEGTVGSKWMDKFGGRYYDNGHIAALRRGLFFNPDLTLRDIFRYRSMKPAEVTVATAVPADSIAVPVAVVTGSHNPAVWVDPARGFYRELKAVKTFVTVDSAGYAPHLERPGAFAAAVKEFLPECRSCL